MEGLAWFGLGVLLGWWGKPLYQAWRLRALYRELRVTQEKLAQLRAARRPVRTFH